MSAPAVEHVNEIRLVGRVADEPNVIVMPSGDELISARLIVERPRPAAGRGLAGKVDTFVCTAWSAPLRRRVRIWVAGDTVEVSGSMRRRFWRGEAGVRNRYEVELAAARLVARSPVVESSDAVLASRVPHE